MALTITSAIARGIFALAASLPLASTAFAQTDQDLIKRGEYLARAGDCVACHSVPEGKPFAGGLKMGTPLGNIYSTNITPDRDTGIGAYSVDDFERAVRKGVARDGHRLYPAMPYPSYAKVSREDIEAMYAYFTKAVAPVNQANKQSEIRWPLNMRWPLAIWNALFFDDKPYQANPQRDAAWNRGAYLVEGLGHCGACHTPRGVAFQEKSLDAGGNAFLSGATLDGWSAPSLRGEHNAGLGRWSEQDVVAFLRDGRNAHASVFGSMLDAYNNSTQFFTADDLTAVAKYLKTLPAVAKEGKPYVYDDKTAQGFARGDLKVRGASIYLTQCAACHGADGKGLSAFLPPLAGNPIVLTKDPSSIVNLVLNGTGRVVTRGVPDPLAMRPFRLTLSDQDIADVTSFIRGAWGNEAPAIEAKDVATLRKSTDMASDQVIMLRMR